MCGKTKTGRFWLTRKTISKRMQAKLAEVKDQCLRRRHQPIPEQGRWVGSVARVHLAYYAVPGNTEAVAAFGNQAMCHRFRALANALAAPGRGCTDSPPGGSRLPACSIPSHACASTPAPKAGAQCGVCPESGGLTM
jgi:hypothetical protein